MKKIILLIVSFFISITAAHADRECHPYSQKTYDALLMRAQNNNDNEAMFTLSTMYCDDCSNDLDVCVKDAMKWLKAAADHGNKKAQSSLIQKHDPYNLDYSHALRFYLENEIKNGDYTIRSYIDSMHYTAYFEILKNNKVIFAPSKNKGAAEYAPAIFQKSLFKDGAPTLEIWLNTVGNGNNEVDVRYFSLGKELKCLVAKNSNSPYWTWRRFDEDYSHEAVNAFETGKAELITCSSPDNLIDESKNVIVSAQSCDKHTIQTQRKIFQNLYSAHHYTDAFDNLNTFISHCRPIITDSQQLMWLQNDLLISLVNLKQKPQCLALSNEIKNNPDFSKTTDSFKTKLQFNMSKCAALP